jgi:NhaA family Na+:H+ antiporter
MVMCCGDNMSQSNDWTGRLSNVLTGVAVLAAVVVAAAVARKEFFGGSTGNGREGIAEPVDNWATLVAGENRIGGSSPSVTIVEFVDFQCPACKRFHDAALRGVLAEYPDKVAVVVRHLPLEGMHPVAYAAARAAQCSAAQGRFAAVYEELLGSQDLLGRISLTKIAERAGVPDMIAFERCLKKPGRVDTIDSDIRLARNLNLRGTPTILINGLLYSSVPDSARLARLVRYQLSHPDEAALQGFN